MTDRNLEIGIKNWDPDMTKDIAEAADAILGEEKDTLRTKTRGKEVRLAFENTSAEARDKFLETLKGKGIDLEGVTSVPEEDLEEIKGIQHRLNGLEQDFANFNRFIEDLYESEMMPYVQSLLGIAGEGRHVHAGARMDDMSQRIRSQLQSSFEDLKEKWQGIAGTYRTTVGELSEGLVQLTENPNDLPELYPRLEGSISRGMQALNHVEEQIDNFNRHVQGVIEDVENEARGLHGRVLEAVGDDVSEEGIARFLHRVRLLQEIFEGNKLRFLSSDLAENALGNLRQLNAKLEELAQS